MNDAPGFGSPSSSTGDGREGRWHREYLAPLISAGLCIIFVVAGWCLIPRHPTVAGREFTLALSTSEGPVPANAVVRLTISAGAPGLYDVTIGGAVLPHEALPITDTLNATFLFAAGSVPSCPALVLCPAPPNPSALSVDVPMNHKVTFAVRTSTFTYGYNGEDAEVWLPNIANVGSAPSPDATIFVSYRIPDPTSYNWTIGDPPEFKHNALQWEQYVWQLGNPILAQGHNAAAQRTDDGRIFLAGAAAALAGATFATALDGFIRSYQAVHRKERPGRRRTATP